MPRSFQFIFNQINKMTEENENTEFLIKCSYLEIYNEKIQDLLEPTASNLQIREDIKKGVYVEALSEEVVSSSNEVVDLIDRGRRNRHVGATDMNQESSRSHSVLTTNIESKTMKDGLWNVKISRFHIIDLAGSERQKLTNAGGERLKEAGMINKSLSALGNVINSLVEMSEGKVRHVHYRDSKLTFLLRDSLGGNSKTLIIACVSPASSSHSETLSTLKFAQRAKLIKNKAVINEDSSGTVAILKDEIKRLKAQVMKQRISYQSLQQEFETASASRSTRTSTQEENLKEVEKEEQPEPLSDSEIAVRLKDCEKLVSKGLENLGELTSYYDKELDQKNSLEKSLALTIDHYKKEINREKMIIKFRDSTISKLNMSEKLSDAESLQLVVDLREEVKVLREAMESEEMLVPLQRELERLKAKNQEFEDTVGKESLSLKAQYSNLLIFTEELNQYFQRYLESSELEREEIIQKRVTEALSDVKLEYGEKINEVQERLMEQTAHSLELSSQIN